MVKVKTSYLHFDSFIVYIVLHSWVHKKYNHLFDKQIMAALRLHQKYKDKTSVLYTEKYWTWNEHY